MIVASVFPFLLSIDLSPPLLLLFIGGC